MIDACASQRAAAPVYRRPSRRDVRSEAARTAPNASKRGRTLAMPVEVVRSRARRRILTGDGRSRRRRPCRNLASARCVQRAGGGARSHDSAPPAAASNAAPPGRTAARASTWKAAAAARARVASGCSALATASPGLAARAFDERRAPSRDRGEHRAARRARRRHRGTSSPDEDGARPRTVDGWQDGPGLPRRPACRAPMKLVYRRYAAARRPPRSGSFGRPTASAAVAAAASCIGPRRRSAPHRQLLSRRGCSSP